MLEKLHKEILKYGVVGIILGCFIVFLVLAVVGFFLKPADPLGPEFMSSGWFGTILWELSKVALTSGIVAAVFQAFRSVGILHATVSDVIFSDDFLNLRNDIDDIWARITRKRYLGEKDNDQLPPDIDDEILIPLNNSLKINPEFIMRDMVRRFTIGWHKDGRKKDVITVTYTSTFKIIPLKKDGTIRWTTTFVAKSGASVGDYQDFDEKLFVDGELIERAIPEENQGDPRFDFEHELSSKSSYDLEIVKQRSWSLKVDNYYEIVSPYVISGGSDIIYEVLADDLEVSFLEYGLEDKHEMVKGGAEGNAVMLRCKTALLPGHGFALFFFSKA